MESQFRQPKKVVNVEVNKQSIARDLKVMRTHHEKVFNRNVLYLSKQQNQFY